MRATYRYLAIAVSAMVLFEAAVLAFGAFDLVHQLDDKRKVDVPAVDNITGLSLHSVGAMILATLVLILFVVSFFAKFEGSVRWAGIVLGLTVLQFALAGIATAAPVVGALHGINAFGIAAMAWVAVKKVPADEPVAVGAPA